MKKLLLLTSIFLPTVCLSNSPAVGEYRFGPETSENLACQIAEEKAKQKAIADFLGQKIESFTHKNCINESCDFHDQILVNVEGNIKKITNYQRKILDKEGYKTCIVKIDAEVEKIESKFNLNVTGKLNYIHGENIDFTLISDKPGFVYVFNYFYDSYDYIYKIQIYRPNTEITVNNLKANLPKYLDHSNEKLLFLFTPKEIGDIKHKYTANEIDNVLSSIPVTNRKVVYRYVSIRRKM